MDSSRPDIHLNTSAVSVAPREASGLKGFVSKLQAETSDVATLGRLFLDSFLETLGFERAFLLVGGSANGSEDASIQVLSARTVRERTEQGEIVQISDQADAELIIQPLMVSQAINTGQLVIERECLVELPPPTAEVRRSVFCLSFELSISEMGILYLDTSVLSEHQVETISNELQDLISVGLPILKVAFLRREVNRTQEALNEYTSDSTDTLDESSDFEIGEDGEPVWNPRNEELPSYFGIVGRSEKLVELFEVVERIKDTDFNVCIFGESGSGKEILARAIHRAGRRRDKEFISENCGAISETLLESELFGHVKGAFTGADENRKGLFELADGGTLFLDEIGDMSEGMQRKLLRVLQEGVIRPIGSKETIRVNVRVICASNRDLKVLMEKGAFRADLYYRLNVISMEVPPLRDRLADIPCLVKFFMEEFKKEGSRRRFSQSALKALMSYNWPGNVRELMNVLQRLMITGQKKKVITRKEVLPLLTGGPARSYVSEDLDREEGGDDNEIILRIPQRQTFNDIISECEKAVLLNALKENRWNKSRVTKVLQIPRQSLYNKIAKYDLKKKWPTEEE